MSEQPPLSTLLSQALVAFTIELDNEFERQMPHRTTGTKSAAASRQGPWLVSFVMWANLLRLVREEGVTVGELERSARIAKPSLTGMERWGYIVVEAEPADPADARPRPPRSDWRVLLTPKGLRAQKVWRPLPDVIEERWQARLGDASISRLREALSAMVRQLDARLPEYLPILGYGFVTEALPPESRGAADLPRLPLSALLSQVLLAWTIEFESASELSLALCADVLRPLSEEGVRVRDLPRLSGVSKEAIQMGLGFLEKGRYVDVVPDETASRARLARLTAKGLKAREAYRQRLGVLEERWRARFGEDSIRNLREALARCVGDPTAPLADSPLSLGLKPYPDGWRAAVRPPDTLPHHPMVLHRGGFPDGA